MSNAYVIDNREDDYCPHCDNTGWIPEGSFSTNPEFNVWIPCIHCNEDQHMPLELV